MRRARWHDGALWFSDLYAGRVHRVTPGGAAAVVIELDSKPAGLEFTSAGELLVVSQQDQRVLRRDSAGELHLYAELSGVARSHANDIVPASNGDAYVTCFGYDLAAGEPAQPAPLMRVTSDGSVSVVADGLRFPNAVVLDPSERTLLLSETAGRSILSYSRRADGTLGEPELWADLGQIQPDGMRLDADGALWVAGVQANCALRVERGGWVIGRIDTPGRWVTGCMLGGPRGDDLFLLTCEPVDPINGRFHGRLEVASALAPHAGRP